MKDDQPTDTTGDIPVEALFPALLGKGVRAEMAYKGDCIYTEEQIRDLGEQLGEALDPECKVFWMTTVKEILLRYGSLRIEVLNA